MTSLLLAVALAAAPASLVPPSPSHHADRGERRIRIHRSRGGDPRVPRTGSREATRPLRRVLRRRVLALALELPLERRNLPPPPPDRPLRPDARPGGARHPGAGASDGALLDAIRGRD